METIYKKLFLVVLLCGLLVGKMSAQEYDEGIEAQDSTKRELTLNEQKHLAAYRYMNGIYTSVDYGKAFSLYFDLAKQGDPKALNAMASMYRQGLGMAQNYEMARNLYKKAINLRYGKSAYNLAQMYKNAQGGPQDMAKAFEYYTTATALGYTSGYYGMGYCYYKGFGIPQDYAKAVKMFTLGNAVENAACSYYLGLCYLGGDGVSKDLVRGKTLIEKAAKQGYDHAVEFITQNRIVNYEDKPQLRSARANGTQRSGAPAYRRIKNNATDNLGGIWEGRILRYDWGRKRIVEEKKLSLQLDYANDGELNGVWLQGDSTSIRVLGHREDSVWVLDNMQYLHFWDRTYEIRQARLEVKTDSAGTVSLLGNIDQFSPQTMEPSSPTMVELKRTVAPIAKNTSRTSAVRLQNSLLASPNPFDKELIADITLQQAQQATLQVTDMSGKAVYSQTSEFTKGMQQKTLNLNLPAGTYVLSLKNKVINLNTLIIRKP